MEYTTVEKTDSNMDFVDAQDMNTMSYVHNPAMGDMSTLPGQQTTWKNFLCKSSHPVVAAFHLLFKLMAILTYMFANWMGLDFVTCFVLVVLFLAADFWVVKNITGRLLVRLRWWNRVKNDTGETEWFFESANDAHSVPAMDKRIFWWALYAAPIIWGICALGAILTLSITWLLVHLVAIGLTGANLIGYTRCSSEARKKVQSSLAIGAAAAGAFSAFQSFSRGAPNAQPGAAGTTTAPGEAGVNTLATGFAGAMASMGNTVASLLGAAANSDLLRVSQNEPTATATAPTLQPTRPVVV